MTPPVEPEDEAYRPRLIRSYTITSGRTAAKVDLAMEATLRLQAGAEAPSYLTPSAMQVLEVCDRRSVAEVSALTKMPIGVTRVLVGTQLAHCRTRTPPTTTDNTSPFARLELIERTLRGLRNY
jgi:hypothetical protein